MSYTLVLLRRSVARRSFRARQPVRCTLCLGMSARLCAVLVLLVTMFVRAAVSVCMASVLGLCYGCFCLCILCCDWFESYVQVGLPVWYVGCCKIFVNHIIGHVSASVWLVLKCLVAGVSAVCPACAFCLGRLWAGLCSVWCDMGFAFVG